MENSAATVLDVLHQKHPAPSPPTPSSLLRCDNLPLLEDVELTGSHILYSARTIQGGAGPGGAMRATGVMLCYAMVPTVPGFVTLLLLLLIG